MTSVKTLCDYKEVNHCPLNTSTSKQLFSFSKAARFHKPKKLK